MAHLNFSQNTRGSKTYKSPLLFLLTLVLTLFTTAYQAAASPTPSPKGTASDTLAATKPSCTPAPAPPDGAPSDWTDTVHPNCFDDLDRLGLWVGGTQALLPGMSPEKDYQMVSPGSIGGSTTEIVVLVHGWAPGFRPAVERAADQILWWSTDATNADGVYSSDWAWVQTAVNTSSVSECVSSTGFFQQLRAHHPKAVVLGFSWLDHSATGGSFLDLVEVYRSEAYTNISGIRLANALEAALSPDFWQSAGNSLHLIGHSHGSKVATVAALTLQQRSKRVDHLTILDSPESEVTLEGNGANLLGFYLDQMQIANPVTGVGGAFVDNNASFFGVSYANLNNIVDINLDPGALYSISDAGDKHSYSAAWYAGAAVGVQAFSLPTPLGLDWPPLPATFRSPVEQTMALNQNFEAKSGISGPCVNQTRTASGQWQLSPGAAQLGPFAYFAPPIGIDGTAAHNVSCTPNCKSPASLTLDPKSTQDPAIFRGGYSNNFFSDGYGLAFDVTWTNATAGDYLVATVDSPEEGQVGAQEVILVMDGRSRPDGTFPVAFNADISSTFDDVQFAFYLVPAAGSKVEVTAANFRRIVVEGL